MPFVLMWILATLKGVSLKTWLKIAAVVAILILIILFAIHERQIGAAKVTDQIDHQNQEATDAADKADARSRSGDRADGVRKSHDWDCEKCM